MEIFNVFYFVQGGTNLFSGISSFPEAWAPISPKKKIINQTSPSGSLGALKSVGPLGALKSAGGPWEAFRPISEHLSENPGRCQKIGPTFLGPFLLLQGQIEASDPDYFPLVSHLASLGI